MKARTLRCADGLAADAAARIRAAGRVPPDQPELVAAMLPAAKRILRAYRWMTWAAGQYDAARAEATSAVADADSQIALIAANWAAAAPEPGSEAARFEEIARHLADVDQAGDDR